MTCYKKKYCLDIVRNKLPQRFHPDLARMETHLIGSDFHIPDHNKKAVELFIDFIKYIKPDKVHILGDFLNCTDISFYPSDPYYHTTIQEELEIGRIILDSIVRATRKNKPNAQIIYYEGNHEERLQRYLGSKARELANLKDDEDYVLSIPHLLGLRDKKIKYIPYRQVHPEGDLVFIHGDKVRSKSGYTAHANLDKYGRSGFSGHTHRFSSVSRSSYKQDLFWCETGCLCNLQPEPAYTYNPDWTQGFVLLQIDNRNYYPQPIRITNNSFVFNSKIFK